MTEVGNHAVRRVTMAGLVSTVAGNGQQGYADGEGAAARFNFPTDVVVDKEGTILVVDRDNNRMRRLTGRHVTTLAGGSEAGTADGAGPGARFTMPNRWRWTSAGACSSPNMDGGTRCGWWRRRSRRRRGWARWRRRRSRRSTKRMRR